jgi:phytoene desaturase
MPEDTQQRVGVIGGGIGGLALAIRLQAAGRAVTLVERRDHAGGTLGWRTLGEWTFDDAPALIEDVPALDALWTVAGHSRGGALDLLPVSPGWRLQWPDGAHFNWGGGTDSAERAALAREVARFAPGDLAGFEAFCDDAAAMRRGADLARARGGSDRFVTACRWAGLMLRHHGWRSLHARAALRVRDERLRQVLSFAALWRGGNPLASPMNELPAAVPAWPRGGARGLVGALTGLFTELGGTLRLGDAATRIEIDGNRASSVTCASGWTGRFDRVCSGAPLLYTWRELLGHTPRGAKMAARLKAKRWSPGVFTVHFAVPGSWPGIPHSSMLMAVRYGSLLTDVFGHGVLPRDMLIRLSHPTVTDPDLAPGVSLFTAHVPVPNTRQLPIDWSEVGPILQARVLGEIGRRLIPDLGDRLLGAWHTTPRDTAEELNAYAGAGFGLEADMLQSGLLRPGHRDKVFAGLHFVGAATRPGAGIAGVLQGAHDAADAVLKEGNA